MSEASPDGKLYIMAYERKFPCSKENIHVPAYSDIHEFKVKRHIWTLDFVWPLFFKIN